MDLMSGQEASQSETMKRCQPKQWDESIKINWFVCLFIYLKKTKYKQKQNVSITGGFKLLSMDQYLANTASFIISTHPPSTILRHISDIIVFHPEICKYS